MTDRRNIEEKNPSVDGAESPWSTFYKRYVDNGGEATTLQAISARGEGTQKSLLFFIALVMVLGAGYGAWAILSGSSLEEGMQIGEEEGKKEIEKVLERVERLIILPEGEIPLMATVVDAEALKSEQPFYAHVIKNDIVLIYQQNQRAIIYSPARDIIVNVGPVQFRPEVVSEHAPEGRSLGRNDEAVAIDDKDDKDDKSLRIEVRNGSNATGAATRLSGELALYPAYTVIETTDAAHAEYEKTIMVNLTGSDGDDAVSNLAALTGALIVTSLPAEEVGTEAEVLIIIGAR